MSKRSSNYEFVKQVPDFIARMGLNTAQLEEHKKQTHEAKLEDKFAKTSKGQEEDDDKDKEYDFENAQIEDLANMLGEGGVLAEKAATEGMTQDKVQELLKKKIAKLDKQINEVVGTNIAVKEIAKNQGKEEEVKQPTFVKRRDRKTIEKTNIKENKVAIDKQPEKIKKGGVQLSFSE